MENEEDHGISFRKKCHHLILRVPKVPRGDGAWLIHQRAYEAKLPSKPPPQQITDIGAIPATIQRSLMASQSEHAGGSEDDAKEGDDVTCRAEGESNLIWACGHLIQLEHALKAGSRGHVLISRQLNHQHS